MKQESLDRRHFLKAALAASGALASTQARTARAATLSDKTIIVIGAGCAGLGAAAALHRQGAEVIVLEGRDRIGGRIQTDWSMGAPFEVGAGWIHGPSPSNPAKQLCDAVGSDYFLTDDDNAVTLSKNGALWSDARLNAAYETFEMVLEDLYDSLALTDERTIYEALKDRHPAVLKDPDMMWALSAYLEFSAGAPIEAVSAATFLQIDEYPGADVIVASGYDRMLQPLTVGLDIRLNTPATAVNYDAMGVRIETPNGPISGDYCICSVPLGILKAGAIRFNPPLPPRQQSAIDQLGFGSVTKIALKFESAFWDEEVQYFGIATEEKGRWNYWLNYRTFSDENILLGVSVGAYAPIADQLSPEEQAADALDVLKDVWGENTVGEPIDVLTTHWSVDPYARGTYTHPTAGTTAQDVMALARPIQGRLILCGEHTFFDHLGTTHGAYMSGLRAADQVLDDAP